jgi:hypothetical protein
VTNGASLGLRPPPSKAVAEAVSAIEKTTVATTTNTVLALLLSFSIVASLSQKRL